MLDLVRDDWQSRFWANVDKRGADDCWPWKASLQTAGYGQCDTPLGTLAHRVAWQLANGRPVPTGLFICHTCEKPNSNDWASRRCANPSHLYPGTRRDNAADAVAKGRMASGDRNGSRAHPERLTRGETHGNSVLTETEVTSIKGWVSRGLSDRHLSTLFAVSIQCIYHIRKGSRWSHVPWPSAAGVSAAHS